MHEDFTPPRWLRGAHIQSILPSLPLRRALVERRARPLLTASRELILDCGDGVRLQAFFSPAPAVRTRGPEVPQDRRVLAVLLHGWEGSAQSLYVLSLAQTLHKNGLDVVRLNLRDHGDTHHLNKELFHSCRLPEVVGAVRRLQFLFPSHRLTLAGFSLGGNFMLRVAAAAPGAGIEVTHAVGVSPVLDPANCLDAMERGWSLYHDYFVRKWLRSLRLKQRAWPGQFTFDDLISLRDLREMTRELVLRHAGYDDVDDYFRGYAITEDRLADLVVPSTLITALDDPIIPAGDLSRLAKPSALKVIVTETGGHCGFFDSLTGPGWADRLILRELQQSAAA
ncbi:MAG: alpha/beta fold hydrolase [Gammaproteobacteria bacterium]|nr:alpha/beta fold hydrolase [Gammaproteobacteria bacterium]